MDNIILLLNKKISDLILMYEKANKLKTPDEITEDALDYIVNENLIPTIDFIPTVELDSDFIILLEQRRDEISEQLSLGKV